VNWAVWIELTNKNVDSDVKQSRHMRCFDGYSEYMNFGLSRKTDRQRGKKTDRIRGGQANEQTGAVVDRQKDRQVERRTGRQADSQAYM